MKCVLCNISGLEIHHNPVSKAVTLCQSFEPALLYLCHVHVDFMTPAAATPPTQSAITAQAQRLQPFPLFKVFHNLTFPTEMKGKKCGM